MSGQFAGRVEQGLELSKRIYYGKAVKPPGLPELPPSRSSPGSYLPTALMVYASVSDPAVVDNPDIPSYQPYVHARCDPPALIPIHMLELEMVVDCWLDTAFVTLRGTWRVHCVMAGRRCDCVVAVPMGEKGSLLGAEVDIIGSGRSYNTKLTTEEEARELENVRTDRDSRFVKSHIYTFKVPQVNGGSRLSAKVSWSQRLLYRDGQFVLNVPFSFPIYVNPVGKDAKRQLIRLNVNPGTGRETCVTSSSHALKMLNRGVGKLSCLYEAQVAAWSNVDFSVSYTVSSGDVSGGVLLQSTSLWDCDKRGIFCLYLFPGTKQQWQVFKKKVVFVIDISRSMQRRLEEVKGALLASLSTFKPDDAFNIIAFSDEVHLFSSSLELATADALSSATQWLNSYLVAGGGTNLLLPLKQAMKLLENTMDALPLVFLVTDGSTEDEREVCNVLKSYCGATTRSLSPRMCTFGIGVFCNHYFLQMLAQIGRGHYDAAYDADNIGSRMQRLFALASSTFVTNVTLGGLKHVDSVELLPSEVRDLTLGGPLVVSGRYRGDFPDSLEVRGLLLDTSSFEMELTVQRAKDMPLDKVLARRQIDALTASSWFSENKELEKEVAKMSVQTGFPSEYTQMIFLNSDDETLGTKPVLIKEILQKPFSKSFNLDWTSEKTLSLGVLGLGFGDLGATGKNLPPGMEQPAKPDGAELLVKAATSCCSSVANRVCCMCFIRCCLRLPGQCSIAFSQLCAALACFECLSCCCELCDWM